MGDLASIAVMNMPDKRKNKEETNPLKEIVKKWRRLRSNAYCRVHERCSKQEVSCVEKEQSQDHKKQQPFEEARPSMSENQSEKEKIGESSSREADQPQIEEVCHRSSRPVQILVAVQKQLNVEVSEKPYTRVYIDGKRLNTPLIYA